jgi:hypothetical protein
VLKPSPFTGSHFKQWTTITYLCLTAIGVHRIVDVTILFMGAILSAWRQFGECLCARPRWEGTTGCVGAKFGPADAGGELYATKHFCDYRMIENRYVLE